MKTLKTLNFHLKKVSIISMCINLIIKINDEPKCGFSGSQKLTFDDGRFSSVIVQIPRNVRLNIMYIVYENQEVLINKYTGEPVEGVTKNDGGDSPYIFVKRWVEIVTFKGSVSEIAAMRSMALEFVDDIKKYK